MWCYTSMLLLYIQLYLSHAYRLDVTSKQCMSNQFSNDGLESVLLRTSLELINKLCNNLVPEFSVLPFVQSVKFVKCWNSHFHCWNFSSPPTTLFLHVECRWQIKTVSVWYWYCTLAYSSHSRSRFSAFICQATLVSI